jgi:hypothetical protein
MCEPRLCPSCCVKFCSLHSAERFRHFFMLHSTHDCQIGLQVDLGWIAVWVKMASQWCCVVLYIWTLLAPRILRNRDFTDRPVGTVAK